MKHFIWLLCGVFVSGLLLGTLSACGSHLGPVHYAVITATEPTSAAPEADTVPEEAEAPAEAPDDDTARRMAYGKVLWDAYLQGVLPADEERHGVKWSLDWTDLESASQNEFALWDVNGDGAEELLLYWTAACTAGQMCAVFTYDGGEVREVLRETPSLTFYDNGTVQADWSHNQGWAMDFWPYTVYRFDPETGAYTQTGAVDAWDSRCNTPAFPAEADEDGDGLVYYLLSGEWERGRRVDQDGNDYYIWSMDPVDGVEYENWRNSWLDGAEPLDIPRQELTEENIAALGCPKPDGPAAEPAG